MVVGRNDGKNHDRGEKQEKGAIKQKKKKKKGRYQWEASHTQDPMGFLIETFPFSFQKLVSGNLKTMLPIVDAFRSKTFFLEHLYT